MDLQYAHIRGLDNGVTIRPKTRQAYTKMFRVFLAFCVYMQVALMEIDVNVILSLCECLVVNHCSVSMIVNYLSAIKASFVLYNMPYSLLDHPRIKYFQKSMRIKRSLAVTSHNVIDLSMLERISKTCDHLNFPAVFRAIFLTSFFGFFQALKFGSSFYLHF